MIKGIRISEYKVLFYRIGLAFVFYFFARILFTVYNYELLGEIGFVDFLNLQYHGMVFDTTAILYLNLLVFFLSAFPFYINTKKSFQKVIFYVYFIFNLVGFATNFIDFIYFRYILSRSTMSSLESIESESNKLVLLASFMTNYWHVFVLFFSLSFLWIWLYKKIKIKEEIPIKKGAYFGFSALFFVLFSVLIVGGIRGGDFRLSTRPINLVDANKFVTNSIQANIVLNTPFAIIRTFNHKTVAKVNFMPDDEISKYLKPIKQYNSQEYTNPNVVILIIESFGREYLGAFNQNFDIKDFQSYTPFIDSLAQHSLIFTNGYSNGSKSIHGMSSVISGIPSFKKAFTSSPYSNQKIESLVSVLKNEGYSTSFFHGAENGSMGFLGYSNVLGIDSYIGRQEYNNDDDFDGYWGIWDEPFLQFVKERLDEEERPFFSTVFTISSHEPYIVPDKYKDKFPEGKIKMHKCVGYTDYALKRFFEEAKKEPWFDNTIFVMVADHSNIIHYPEYQQPLNFYTIPILFYSSNEKFKGINEDFAQQIDIYPTILDMIGYKKPFRSWGRSLINDEDEPFVIRHMNNVYYYFYKDFVCLFDGEKVIGLYRFNDKSMKKNMMDENQELTKELEFRCKAFIQDYMNRIVDGELN